MQTLVVPRRLLRRLQKQRLGIAGFGREVPHAHCCAATRAQLETIADPGDLPRGDDLAATLLLVATPERDRIDPDGILLETWRYAFHAAVHAHFAAKPLPLSAIRERIHRVGQTELDEVRAVLRSEGLLAQPRDDHEVYEELAALYLELEHFAPDDLEGVLPGLSDMDHVRAVLHADVPVDELLVATRPAGAPDRPRKRVETVPPERHTSDLPPSGARSEGAGEHRAAAAKARDAGNVALAAVHTAKAGDDVGPDLRKLGERLAAVLGDRSPSSDEIARALGPLALRAAKSSALRPLEGRLLYDVQKACIESERERKTIDVVTWVSTVFRRPLVRTLPTVGVVRTARALRQAREKATHVRLSRDEEQELVRVIARCLHTAEDAAKELVVPTVERTLTEVGLEPRTLPEEVAREKLAHELAESILDRGFIGLGHLRDALSRSHVKMKNLTLGELVFGDALLRADRLLSERLDGLYRRGEAYMRLLQKASSLAFGTVLGRLLVLYAMLPLLSSFVVLEGLTHLLHPLMRLFGGGHPPHGPPPAHHAGRGHHGPPPALSTHPTPPDLSALVPPDASALVPPDASALVPPDVSAQAPALPHGPPDHGVHLLNTWSLIGLALVVFGLLHSKTVRSIVFGAFGVLGLALKSVFVTFPVWCATRPLVLRILSSRFASLVLKPLAVGGPAYALAQRRLDTGPALGLAAVVVAGVALFLGTRLGVRLEEWAADAAFRFFRRLRRQVLPGLLAFVAGVFRALVERIDRVIYAVDELLTFRTGDSIVSKVAKGAFGFVWFFVTYLVRIYVNLLIEPQVNPIKHFPVVTVSHKMTLPLAPTLIQGLSGALTPLLGKALATTFASTTVLLMPGVFGFLVWELKENWKLYGQNRSKELDRAIVGHHGESVAGLLLPGFHSGTLPKLFAKLRERTRQGTGGVFALEEAIHEVEHAVELFVERELCRMLSRSPRFGRELSVDKVTATSNRIRVVLRLDGEPAALELSFEEQSGWLVAEIVRRGFVDALDPGHRSAFSDALAGLYKRAGVEIVREQVGRVLGGAPFDVADEGLVVWPDGSYVTEVLYPLDDADELPGQVRSGKYQPKPLRARDVLFAEQELPYASWVRAWGREGAELPRVLPAEAAS